jgi:hypothetical protein
MNERQQIRSQVVADLAIQLAEVTSIERTGEILQRALRSTGLTRATLFNDEDVSALLQAIAAEGGLVQQLAEQIAVSGLELGTDPQRAA